MRILGIESSCDDTSVALLDSGPEGHYIISEQNASQIPVHQKYGGVVPEIAGRLHAEKILPLIEAALEKNQRPEAIAVTAGPGLITGLLVGVEAARALSYSWNIPLVAVNHLAGHITSVELSGKNEPRQLISFPALSLVVSGGHTELVYMPERGVYQVLGKTKDDAAGECFDKVAKLLGFPYPGGPHISRLAKTGNPTAIPFPRPMLDRDNFDFSFAGLKTAALYWLRDHTLSTADPAAPPPPAVFFGQSTTPPTINDFSASLEEAIVAVLVGKTLRAVQKIKPKSLVLGGGVSANPRLRSLLAAELEKTLPDFPLLTPESSYCMDNAAMIAAAGYYLAAKKEFTDWQTLTGNPNWGL